MIVLESTPDDTENAILDGILALIRPVMTLTDGLIDEVGGLKEALAKLHQMIDENGTENG